VSRSVSLVLRGLGRTVRFIAVAIGVVLTFVLALVVSVLLQLDLPAARRVAVREINGILAPQFKGKIVITRLGHLSIFGVGGLDVQVTAADGTRVLTGRGVAARISPLTIVRSALLGKGDLMIAVDSLKIDSVDGDLDTRPDGSLKLVGAFDPATPSPPAKPGARGTAIRLSDILVSHAWTHGVLAGAPPIDVDVDNLRATFLSATNATKLDVSRLVLTARGLPMGIHAHALVEAHLAMPSPTGQSMAVQAALDATVGKIPLTARVSMDGDALDAVLDVPEVSSEDVRASVEDAPVYQTIAAHAEAHGDLSSLKTGLHARLGVGSLDVDGTVHAKGPLGADLVLLARHLDARTFSEKGPATDIGVRIAAVAETKVDKAIVGHATIDVPVGTAAGQMVPHVALQLEVEQRVDKEGAPAMLTGHVEGIVDEPGAPLALTADGESRGGVSNITFGAKADVPRLGAVKRLGDIGSGSLQLTLSGHARIAKAVTFEADVDALGHGVEAKGVRVDDVRVLAKATGTPTSPTFEARTLATGLVASGYAFSRAEVEVAGTPSNVRVAVSASAKKGPDVKVQTEVSLVPALALRDLRLGLERGQDALRVSVDSVRLEAGGVVASGLVVHGAGEPLSGSFRGVPGLVVVKAKSAGLDLGKLAYLAGQDRKLGGTLAFDVDVEARRDRAHGEVTLDLTKGSVSTVRDAEAHLRLQLDGRHVVGGLHAFAGDAGSFDLHDVDVHIGGADALDVSAWKRAWGKLGVRANLDMERVASLLPPGALNLTDLAGRVALDGEIERDSLEDTTPEVRLSLVTNGLRATGQSTAPVREPGGPLMVGPATWTLYGMDVRGDLVIDGVDSAGELDLRIVDKEGALAAFDVKTDPLPFATLLSGHGDLVAQLEQLPVGVRVDIPERELSQLPLLIRPDGVRGGAAVALTMKGTAVHPNVAVTMQARGLIVAGAPKTSMDGEITARYDGSLAKVSATLRSKTEALLDASAELHANAKDFLSNGDTAPAWGGSAKATLARFPLEAVSALSQDQIKGFVSGDLSVTGLHDHARAALNLALESLQMGKAKFSKGTVRATLDDAGLDAKARLESSDGFMEANAKMGMKWGASLAPSPDGTGVQATLRAKHFSAAAAAPFASGAVSELSGWLDADAKVALLPGQKPRMAGSLTFSDGVVQAPSIGEEFHAVKAKVTLTEDGVVKIADVEARGLSGRMTASGSARLDGTTLLGADLALNIKKGDGIPLDIQGTNLGSIYGDVVVKATGSSDGKSIKVAVNVPDFHVELPEAGFPRSPQGLASAAGVHIGVYRDPDRFIVLPVDGAPVKLVAERNAAIASLPISGGVKPPPPPPPGQAEALKAGAPSTALDVTVQLGNVHIVRGQQLVIDLGGNVSAKVGAATQVRGQIRVKSGKLEVQSKGFQIEKGTISFVGDDPANPEVNLTAGWTAPDGTRVLADYIGPVKTGKVTLRSEPPRPKNEIVSLILFGTADGSSATPYASKSPSTGTEAGTTVGGLATDGLSKGLDQLTGMDVTAKIDTSDAANPRPEVEVQIAKDISLELSVVIGTPPPGTNPDTSYATIDWRFVRNWSLATTFGDEGSTFADLIWQYRY
jgi:translocation and assembly module TamB